MVRTPEGFVPQALVHRRIDQLGNRLVRIPGSGSCKSNWTSSAELTTTEDYPRSHYTFGIRTVRSLVHEAARTHGFPVGCVVYVRCGLLHVSRRIGFSLTLNDRHLFDEYD